MEGRNEFYRGLDMDTDPHKTSPDTMRDALNIRLIDDAGHGLCAVNINGNEYRFSLKPLYVPLGYCVFNGIAYIFSTCPTLTNSCEIGCYPAPNGTGGFLKDINGEPVYQALQNWTGNSLSNPRGDFNTGLLNFSVSQQIQAFARIDYDNSVNIYWTDNNNMYRSVNSGFDQNGVYNNRLYYTGNFNQINVFAESPMPPIITGMKQTLGGALLCGNYFFFLRYSTADFQKTSFLSQSWATQISLKAVNDMSIDGAPGSTVSPYQALFSVTNLDPSYAFFEVGVVYYAQGTSSVYLIDEEYSVADAIKSGTFLVTGNEAQVSLTMADIQRRKSTFSVPKTITQLENRAWLGNLHEKNQLTSALINFANSIKIGFDDTLAVADKPFDTSDTVATNGEYKDAQKTYNEVGFFRGETYPFGMVFVYEDGTESLSIPCKGFDDWAPPFGTNKANTDGIYRFPNAQNSPFRVGVDTTAGKGVLKIMGVKFDWTGLTIPAGIIGWYFVRGEREPNLIYQGISYPTWNSKGVYTGNLDNLFTGSSGVSFPSDGISSQGYTDVQNSNTGNGYSIPLVESYVPFTLYTSPLIGHSGTYNIILLVQPFGIKTIINEDTTRKGFYSPDHFFEGIFSDGAYTVYKLSDVFVTGMNVVNMNAQSGYNALDFLFEIFVMDFSKYKLISNSMQCNNVLGFNPANINGFVSSFNQGTSSEPNCFYFNHDNNLLGNKDELYNRAFATNRYIGLTDNGALTWSSGQGNIYPTFGVYPLVNIYASDPDPGHGYNITTLYTPKNVSYFKISNFISSTQLSTKQTCYNGDCFLQRTYLKQLYNFDNIDSDGTVDTLGGGVHNAHGIIICLVTENNTNTAMRVATLNNFYYPKSQNSLNTGLNQRGFQAVASGNNASESAVLNVGYNQTLSGFFYTGFDKQLPFQETRFPTRIMYSNFHPNGSFTDFYRIFDLAAYQDYDYRLGEITNILDFHSRLVSVQQSGINYHLVNERAMMNSATAGELLIGTGDVLSPKTNVISDVYGSQHQWGIIKTDYNIYGIDYNKRLIWRVKGDGGFEPLSDTRKVSKWITNVFLPLSNPESTISNTFPDNPIRGTGIAAAYDRKYQDVIFTVLGLVNQTGGKPAIPFADTICFNELQDVFSTRYGYNSGFYMTLNNDFFSANPIFDINYPAAGIYQNFYIHDSAVTIGGSNNLQTFYSALQKSSITFIHNQPSDQEKIYEHLEISSNGNEYSNIIYNTEEQVSNGVTFRQPSAAWIDPRFRENFWLVPVPRATAVNGTPNNPDSVESVMRGKYMSVYLEYNNNVLQYTKSILTFFRISY